ncbi:ABC permease subunit efflux system [Alkalihalophilus pseudofirmus OF4]|uniref:ABC permease subunit efflux system n=1 Tax=Alkalihalophilus pseudofirmus (strain ATCC BAA-2126 / JCM 17055 / OF4) TaxID=398511 RepID=D3FZJ6_ALKPO|nr:efflux RND transporter periplasmic adaptor subunit [Alkalihalophilus pseudofirmus]ADC49238.1 ABC permease subunit efflux system [Alkalihalophilus pseudofirmus OF4]
MKKKVWIGSAIVLSVILFTAIAVVQSQGSDTFDVEAAAPEIQTVKHEIMVPGEMELAEMEHIRIRAEEDYTLLVEEGDTVEAGTPLIEYTSEDLEFESEQLAIQIEAGYLRINQVGKQEDRLSDERNKLADDVGREEARDHFRSEHEQLDYEKRAANLDLRQLLKQKEQLENRTKNLTEESPIAGVVLKIDEGTEAQVTIASTESFIASGDLSEYDSLEIKEGQKVGITSDAILDQTWTGVIDQIDFLPSQNELDGTGIKYPFTVKVEEGDTSSLRPGYQVILNVVSDEREALTVPISAVRQLDDTAYVYTIVEGAAVEREVELGMTSDGRYEIRSGLSESDQIISDIPEGLRDGSEVIVLD